MKMYRIQFESLKNTQKRCLFSSVRQCAKLYPICVNVHMGKMQMHSAVGKSTPHNYAIAPCLFVFARLRASGQTFAYKT